MAQAICEKKENTLLDLYLSRRIEGELIENSEGIPVIQSILIGGKKMSLDEITDIETLSTFFDSIAEIGGGLDPNTTIDFVANIASSFPGGLNKVTFDRAIGLFQKMKPHDPIEARLLAQHFILHEQGMKYLNLCSNTEMLCHSQHFGILSMKMLKLSQESIQTLIKYKNKGTQQINIVHMQDNAKAVVIGGT